MWLYFLLLVHGLCYAPLLDCLAVEFFLYKLVRGAVTSVGLQESDDTKLAVRSTIVLIACGRGSSAKN